MRVCKEHMATLTQIYERVGRNSFSISDVRGIIGNHIFLRKMTQTTPPAIVRLEKGTSTANCIYRLSDRLVYQLEHKQ